MAVICQHVMNLYALALASLHEQNDAAELSLQTSNVSGCLI